MSRRVNRFITWTERALRTLATRARQAAQTGGVRSTDAAPTTQVKKPRSAAADEHEQVMNYR